jgi:Sugar phosphate isomerases/epimerases
MAASALPYILEEPLVFHRDAISRRNVIASVAGMGAAVLTSAALGDDMQPTTGEAPAQSQFKYCLNTSTIRGQKLSVPDQVDLAVKAGYDAIEPWLSDLHKFVETGGSLADLRKRLADHGLAVASAIGFAEWIVDDDARRAAGLEVAKKDMGVVAAIGGTHLAAPPAGATKQTNLDLGKAAERYRALLELGQKEGVVPELELWGFSTTLSKLSDVVTVAIEARHPRACLLLDIYHLYKGGSDYSGLRLLSGRSLPCIHMNDYPDTPPRAEIKDADRIMPGDGIAPLAQILRDLAAIGFRGALSLELFNANYWKEDPHGVARIGLLKMKEAVVKAFQGQ